MKTLCNNPEWDTYDNIRVPTKRVLKLHRVGEI